MKSNLETQGFTRRQALITLGAGAASLLAMNAIAKLPTDKGNSANALTKEESLIANNTSKPFVLSF